jgi:hypothetical protein
MKLDNATNLDRKSGNVGHPSGLGFAFRKL